MASRTSGVSRKRQNHYSERLGRSRGHREIPRSRMWREAGFQRVRQVFQINREPWPIFGAAIAGGAGLALASAVGVGELAIGGMTAYVAFRMIRERASFRRIIGKSFKHGMGNQERFDKNESHRIK
jgi:hypothetical protein